MKKSQTLSHLVFSVCVCVFSRVTLHLCRLSGNRGGTSAAGLEQRSCDLWFDVQTENIENGIGHLRMSREAGRGGRGVKRRSVGEGETPAVGKRLRVWLWNAQVRTR